MANDMVGNLIHSLPIFKLWNLMDDKLLADADGQKLPTSESFTVPLQCGNSASPVLRRGNRSDLIALLNQDPEWYQ